MLEENDPLSSGGNRDIRTPGHNNQNPTLDKVAINAEGLHFMETLYQQYIEDKDSVSQDYKNYFRTFKTEASEPTEQSRDLDVVAKSIPAFNHQHPSPEVISGFHKQNTQQQEQAFQTKSFPNNPFPNNHDGSSSAWGNNIAPTTNPPKFSEPIHGTVDLLKQTVDQNEPSPHKSFFESEKKLDLFTDSSVALSDVKKSLPQDFDDGVLDKIRLHRLFNGYRLRGHRRAQLDPLDLDGEERRLKIPELELNAYQFKDEDLDQTFDLSGVSKFKPNKMTLRDIVSTLEKVYSQYFAVEFMYINDENRKKWLVEQVESHFCQDNLPQQEKINTLKDLIAANEFEKTLSIRYPGAKTFSLEGCDSLIPLLRKLISRSASHYQIREIVMGMAHRGRLNVMVNIMGKNPTNLFNLFEHKTTESFNDEVHAFTGDVKYHQGYYSKGKLSGKDMDVALLFNPSHLEIISPVVEGVVRARQNQDETPFASGRVLPVVLHGDAAIAGQGVVMETLQLAATRGFGTGGSVHIVINNQIGFTTSYKQDARSTHYCTDIFKMIDAPILHVNADSPESVIKAVTIALDYRMRFNQDIVIDLVGYRKRGHNEADDPSVTQPSMYNQIKKHSDCADLYATSLIEKKVINQEDYKRWIAEYKKKLDSGKPVSSVLEKEPLKRQFQNWDGYRHKWQENDTDTSLDYDVRILAEDIFRVPNQFRLNRNVEKVYSNRLTALREGKGIDWGAAENLAYASVLHDGYWIRLTGQDCGRGTFAHRHAVVYDTNSGDRHIPLRQLSKKKDSEYGHFEIYDSLLSEEAVLGFEYGYSITAPNSLVIWEAQFGDFVNGAQVLIDQFIASGEQKWKCLSGLTMLLPHGYEGAGPEHSSARIERFLQLCAHNNIQVCVPTLPSQIFHLIRRQVKQMSRKPLVILTPKSLLRHKRVVSTVDSLNKGKFETVLDDELLTNPEEKAKITRMIICSGKVYYDLLQARLEHEVKDVAIVRLEQFYPFPKQCLMQIIKPYTSLQEINWMQEEPINQGGWFYVRNKLSDVCGELRLDDQKMKIISTARVESSSPAVGNARLHEKEQKGIVEKALCLPSATTNATKGKSS